MANKNVIGWWVVSTLMVVGSVGVLGWAVFVRFESASGGPMSGPAYVLPTSMPASATFPPVEQFARIWTKNIRRSLDGTTPAVPATAEMSAPASAAPEPNLNVKLIATAVDAQRPCAIFADAEQNPVVCTVGQVVEGMTVVSIESRKVTLECQGQRFELALPDQYNWSGASSAPVSASPVSAKPAVAAGVSNSP